MSTARHHSNRGAGISPRLVLHIGSTAGAPWWDMWDSKITDRMGRKKFQAGDTVQFSSTFWTHGRCYRMDWNGVYVLAN